MKTKTKAIIILFLFLASWGRFSLAGQAAEIPTPRLLRVDQSQDQSRPLVTGLNHRQTEVLIYLNSRYIGPAEVNASGTITDDFYFRFPDTLAAGEYIVQAVGRDRTSQVLSPMSRGIEFVVEELPAPILIEPNEDTVTARVKPLIIGLAKSGTRALIYIDNELNGQTDMLGDKSGTADFAYEPFLNLAPGWHTAWARIQDEQGRTSPPSNILNFRIEEQLPAPVLKSPVINASSSPASPFIVGVAKNDVRIRVFIDREFNGEAEVVNHPSGAAHFFYRPFLPLAPGPHLIYATAIDERGKESRWSNLMSYHVPMAKASDADGISVLSDELDIPPAAVLPDDDDAADTGAGSEAEPDGSNAPGDVDSGGAGSEGSEVDLSDNLPGDGDEQDEASGAIDEDQENQGKLRLNLIIFILFLLAVIAWIFWVNRELIREKQEKEDKSESGKKEDEDRII